MASTSEHDRNSLVDDLRAQLTGDVITAEDPSFDEARQVVFKGIDKRPLAVARVAGADDVAAVVKAARDGGLELAVRSGGHSRPGYGTVDGGLVIDLSEMDGVEIDADGEAAWVETGATAGRYTLATAERGRVTGLGDTGSVGIGGITLAGGIGFLARKTGLTIDNLLAAEVVTADGRVVQASEDSEPDLFWAIRGGEGNFGVATRLAVALGRGLGDRRRHADPARVAAGDHGLPRGRAGGARGALHDRERDDRPAAALPARSGARQAGADGPVRLRRSRSTTASR